MNLNFLLRHLLFALFECFFYFLHLELCRLFMVLLLDFILFCGLIQWSCCIHVIYRPVGVLRIVVDILVCDMDFIYVILDARRVTTFKHSTNICTLVWINLSMAIDVVMPRIILTQLLREARWSLMILILQFLFWGLLILLIWLLILMNISFGRWWKAHVYLVVNCGVIHSDFHLIETAVLNFPSRSIWPRNADIVAILDDSPRRKWVLLPIIHLFKIITNKI